MHTEVTKLKIELQAVCSEQVNGVCASIVHMSPHMSGVCRVVGGEGDY